MPVLENTSPLPASSKEEVKEYPLFLFHIQYNNNALHFTASLARR